MGRRLILKSKVQFLSNLFENKHQLTPVVDSLNSDHLGTNLNASFQPGPIQPFSSYTTLAIVNERVHCLRFPKATLVILHKYKPLLYWIKYKRMRSQSVPLAIVDF